MNSNTTKMYIIIGVKNTQYISEAIPKPSVLVYSTMWISSEHDQLCYTRHNSIFTLGFSLEMPVPSQGHYGFHSFPVVD